MSLWTENDDGETIFINTSAKAQQSPLIKSGLIHRQSQ